MNDLKKIFIVYDAILDSKGANRTVGGIQSYLLALGKVFKDEGIQVYILQESEVDFENFIDGVHILGRVPKNKKPEKKYNSLLNRVEELININDTLIVWGSFYYTPKNVKYHSISIQHGVSFDLINESTKNKILIKLKLAKLIKIIQCWQAEKRFKRSKFRVCVDYNFLNWYRTRTDRKDDVRQWVIPNFTNIPKWKVTNKIGFKKILFARRFVHKRGVVEMVEASRKLLASYSDISFTFAGEGPLRGIIESLQKEFPNRVTICKYEPDESIDFHREYDIAVIPTIGSEGTSMSLLEAMASGCAVICSNVGGMTNIVIDGFNGIIINPRANEIERSISYVIENPNKVNEMISRARETVEYGFSDKIWSEKWLTVIESAWSQKSINLSN